MALDRRLELVSYFRFKPEDLGGQLYALVRSNQERINREFPATKKRYGSPERAVASVRETREVMRENPDTYCAFVARLDEQVIGIVTFWQQQVTRSHWWLKHVVVEGPQVALWLGSRGARPAAPPVLPELLRVMARTLRGMNMPGQPWTIVRAGHEHMQRNLEASNNGFGGFRKLGKPESYRRVDGGRLLRQLYVADSLVEP